LTQTSAAFQMGVVNVPLELTVFDWQSMHLSLYLHGISEVSVIWVM
jgi:hypothetical protein